MPDTMDFMKTCNMCHLELSLNDFHIDRIKKDGHCGACKSCNGERAAKNQAATNARNRIWIAEQKDKPCADCGNKYPSVCMDFDHLGDKVEIVSRMVWANVAKETILAEIAKCDLVCSNCHRIRTFLKRKQCGAPRRYDRSGW